MRSVATVCCEAIGQATPQHLETAQGGLVVEGEDESHYHLDLASTQKATPMQVRNALLAAVAFTLVAGNAQAADEVVVYSSRIDELIKPVFDAYTAKTGVKVKFITDKEAPLMQRIKAEAAKSAARK